MSNFRIYKTNFVDQTNRISFKFDGKTFFGFKGDTLASALIANGIHLIGRSFKYHRPRGIMTCGSEEPNAICQINDKSNLTEPNVRATEIELYEGLEANSQNCWPNVQLIILFHHLYRLVFITKLLCGQKVFGRVYTNL
jgi:hypothetical protein